MNVTAVIGLEANAQFQKAVGDVVGIFPSGHQVGGASAKTKLILELTMPSEITLDQVTELLPSTYKANAVMGLENEEGIRRYKVNISALDALLQAAGIVVDWNRVYDFNDAYQPLSNQTNAPGGRNTYLDATKVIFDKYKNALLKAEDFINYIKA